MLLRKRFKLRNGFTFVEVLVSFIIFIVITLSIAASFAYSVTTIARQKSTAKAQSIAEDIMNKLVRSQKFDFLFNYSNPSAPVNANLSLASYGAYLYPPNNYIIMPVLASGNVNSFYDFSELRKLSNVKAEVRLYPIKDSSNVLLTDKLAVKVIVSWGTAQNTPSERAFKTELSTVVAKNGLLGQ